MSIIEALEEIEDKRIDRCKKHKLSDILMLCLLGFLCGLKDIENLVYWAELREKRLKQVMPLENGIPSADTVLRVLSLIDPKQFESVFTKVTHSYFNENSGQDFVALDGKTIRGSKKEGNKGVHIVSAWAHKLGLCLGQVKTEEKSNEITAIPELLDIIDLKNIIVTIDAMGCQKKITEKIVEKKSDYVISLKGNQSTLHNNVKDFFEAFEDKGFSNKYELQKTERVLEKDHGRIETRQAFLCTDIEWLKEKEGWLGLNAIGMIKSSRTIKGVTVHENRYFITSLKDVDKASKALRAHWGIENSLHWVLDMIFDEDASRVRKDHSPQNLAIVRKFSLNLLRKVRDMSETMKKKPFTKFQTRCREDDEFLKDVLTYL